jgi:hypothetical protein
VLPAGGYSYSFDAAQGPKAVFSRFFGTANPYEALNGGSLQLVNLFGSCSWTSVHGQQQQCM